MTMERRIASSAPRPTERPALPARSVRTEAKTAQRGALPETSTACAAWVRLCFVDTLGASARPQTALRVAPSCHGQTIPSHR